MTNPTRNILTGLLVLSALATSLPAQTPATGDPFVKDAAARTKKDEPWQNLIGILEVYTLDKNDAAATLETEQGSAARYRRLQDLVKAGKARLGALTALTGKSGQRSALESVDAVRTPSKFASPNPRTGFVPPTAWETRNTGDTLEFEIVVGPDRRTCDVNIVPQRVRFLGFQDLPAMDLDAVIAQPRFDVQRLTTSVAALEGEPLYMGTMTLPSPMGVANGAAASEISMAFLQVHLPSPTPADLAPPAKPSSPGTVTLDYLWYSVERAQAREILLSSSALNAPWEQLQTMLKDKKARLEHLVTINTKSGQRAVVEEQAQIPYGSAYTPESWGAKPASDAKKSPGPETTGSSVEASAVRQPGYFSAFESGSFGVTVEVEPVILNDGASIDLNQVVQSVTFQENLQGTGVASKYPPQPVVENRKITTSLTILFGKPAFAGTFNPPGSDGVNEHKDTGRTYLLFVRAQAGR